MKNKAKIKNYLFLHILIFILSFSGVASKFAAKHEFLSFEYILFYGISIFVLGFYALAWQQVLKRIPLTTAFCNKAATIIWGMLWGVLIFGEQITINMIIGAVIVLIGVCLVVTSDE